MKVEIIYEDRQYALIFAVIYFPAIDLWLHDHGIDYTIEIIRAFEWIESPLEWYYSGGYGETVQKGRRYIFSNEHDAVLFKLRWCHTQIDEKDEIVQQYLTTLRRGCNQSVASYIEHSCK